jgi:hypothetical protein
MNKSLLVFLSKKNVVLKPSVDAATEAPPA